MNKSSITKTGQEPITRSDLVELILTPIAEQINLVRMNMLQSFKEVEERIEDTAESIAILARQVERDLQNSANSMGEESTG